MIHVVQVVNDVFASNTYILSEDDSCEYWLVDIGDFKKVMSILPQNAIIKGVFLTHSHFDHIYGLNNLYKYFAQSIVYTSEYGKKALYSEKMNFSFYHESPIVYRGSNIIILKDGDKISLWKGVIMEVVETPGHCPSCLTYILDQYIFTGDSYIPGLEVVSKLPRGNKRQAMESKLKILALASKKNVCAGHGGIVKME